MSKTYGFKSRHSHQNFGFPLLREPEIFISTRGTGLEKGGFAKQNCDLPGDGRKARGRVGATVAPWQAVTRTKQYKSEPKAGGRWVRICSLFRRSEFDLWQKQTKLKNGGQENESECR